MSTKKPTESKATRNGSTVAEEASIVIQGDDLKALVMEFKHIMARFAEETGTVPFTGCLAVEAFEGWVKIMGKKYNLISVKELVPKAAGAALAFRNNDEVGMFSYTKALVMATLHLNNSENETRTIVADILTEELIPEAKDMGRQITADDLLQLALGACQPFALEGDRT